MERFIPLRRRAEPLHASPSFSVSLYVDSEDSGSNSALSNDENGSAATPRRSGVSIDAFKDRTLKALVVEVSIEQSPKDVARKARAIPT